MWNGFSFNARYENRKVYRDRIAFPCEVKSKNFVVAAFAEPPYRVSSRNLLLMRSMGFCSVLSGNCKYLAIVEQALFR